MSTTFNIDELAREIGSLEAHHRSGKIAIVLPLDAERRDVARAILTEEPPFNPGAVGLDSHEVFLTDNEAVFVFAAGDLRSLEQVLADRELWEVVSSWEHIAAGPPRVAEVVFDWKRR